MLYILSLAVVEGLDVFIRKACKDILLNNLRLVYLHRNPVKADFVSSFEDNRYSSTRDYCREKDLMEVVLVA